MQRSSETLITTNSKPILNGLAALTILVLVFPFVCSNTQAQTITTFTPAEKFTIPKLNGTISFAVNGSCSAATFENDTWNFKDLRLNASQSVGNLQVSAENSNITVTFYRAPTSSLSRSASLRYTVEGKGKQTINLGLNSSRPSSASEWNVRIQNSDFLAEGEGWKLLPDDTVVITGANGNVTITHSGFSVPNESNLPFYQQHSVAIITIILLAITVTIASIIKVKMRK